MGIESVSLSDQRVPVDELHLAKAIRRVCAGPQSGNGVLRLISPYYRLNTGFIRLSPRDVAS